MFSLPLHKFLDLTSLTVTLKYATSTLHLYYKYTTSTLQLYY